MTTTLLFRLLVLLGVCVLPQWAEEPIPLIGPVARIGGVDGPTVNTVVTAVPVGESPIALTATVAGRRVFTGNRQTVRVADEVQIHSMPQEAAVTPDGRRAYVAHADENRVGVYDVGSGAELALIPVAETPYAVAMHPDGTRVYVTAAKGSNLAVISTQSNTVTQRIPIGKAGMAIAISPDGERVFVAAQSGGAGAIWAIDTRQNKVTGVVRGSFGDAIAVAADGERLYGIDDTGLVTLRAEPLTLLKTDSLDGYVSSIGVPARGGKLYLSYPMENATKVFDRATGQMEGTVESGLFPVDVVISTRGR